MITLNEAEHLVDALSSKSVEINQSHCVCVRNRNATCHACVQSCPKQALTVENNHISLDQNACTHCGSCANVCPTQAISSCSLPHIEWALLLQALSDSSRNDPDSNHQQQSVNETPQLWICCKEHPLANDNLKHLHVLPCLAHLDEVHYLLAAYYGISLHILHNDCSQCQNAPVEPLIRETLMSAKGIAQHWHIPYSWNLSQETTKLDSSYPTQYDVGGYSRRGFFTSIRQSMEQFGITVVDTALESTFTQNNHVPTLAEQLNQAPGKLAIFYPQRNTALLNILFDAAQGNTSHKVPQSTLSQDDFSSRFWGNASIDSSCQNCGICAQFCPTGALTYKGKHPQSPMFRTALGVSKLNREASNGPNHEFRCSDCIQCHLCEDLCPAQAIHITSQIKDNDLFDLEPHNLKRHDEPKQG